MPQKGLAAAPALQMVEQLSQYLHAARVTSALKPLIQTIAVAADSPDFNLSQGIA
jgi:hypothetical protein